MLANNIKIVEDNGRMQFFVVSSRFLNYIFLLTVVKSCIDVTFVLTVKGLDFKVTVTLKWFCEKENTYLI